MNNIWIIEDHAPFRRTLARVLKAENEFCRIREFDACEKALAVMEGNEVPDLVLLDVGLPGMSGLDGLRLIRQSCPKAVVVILNGL